MSHIQARSDEGVYAVLFEGFYHGTPPAAMVVTDAAVPMPTIGGDGKLASWLTQFDDLPPSLRQAVSQASPTVKRPFAPPEFPPGTRLVPLSDIRAIFTGTRDDWTAFRRQFNAAGWMSFSEILYTPDRLDALVYYAASCGGLCGEGGYAWIHRDSPQSRWSLKKKIVSFMA